MPIVIGTTPRLRDKLQGLATCRFVFMAGLPGTGKSLLVHQLAHLAAGAGRTVHLLQWDVARPLFEASPAGGRYPLKDGVTHATIRKAAPADAMVERLPRKPTSVSRSVATKGSSTSSFGSMALREASR